jgi:cold shock CspA family protein
MRIGRVVRVYPEKKFGFIQADNLREDIFFHFSALADGIRADHWESGQEVEFEIDELKRMEGEQLRATLVRLSDRPQEVKINEGGLSSFNHKHHPKARQRKPTWRKKDDAS